MSATVQRANTSATAQRANTPAAAQRANTSETAQGTNTSTVIQRADLLPSSIINTSAIPTTTYRLPMSSVNHSVSMPFTAPPSQPFSLLNPTAIVTAPPVYNQLYTAGQARPTSPLTWSSVAAPSAPVAASSAQPSQLVHPPPVSSSDENILSTTNQISSNCQSSSTMSAGYPSVPGAVVRPRAHTPLGSTTTLNIPATRPITVNRSGGFCETVIDGVHYRFRLPTNLNSPVTIRFPNDKNYHLVSAQSSDSSNTPTTSH